MSEPALRIALIGLGDIAVRAHLPALAREQRVTLVAVADVEEERLAAAPEGARRTTDVASVLTDPEIDAVVIATPPAATAGLVRGALDAGKWVLAEKPLGLSVAETADVRAAPGATERLQIGLTYRHHPAVDRLRELIADGTLGRPLLIQAALCDEPANPDQDPRAYARRLRSLERIPPVVSDGVHACDRINYLLGEPPVDVSGWSLRTDPTYRESERERRRPHLRGRHDRAARRRLADAGAAAEPVRRHRTERPRDPRPADVPAHGRACGRHDGDARAARRQDRGLLRAPARRFVDAALAGTPPVPGLDEAIASLELAERIARAAGVGRQVSESSVPA